MVDNPPARMAAAAAGAVPTPGPAWTAYGGTRGNTGSGGAGDPLRRTVPAGLQVSCEEADELILEYGIPEAWLVESEATGPAGPTLQLDRPVRVTEDVAAEVGRAR